MKINKTYKGSIKRRLIGIILLVVSLTSILGYSAFVSWYMTDQYDKARQLSETVAHVLAQNFAKVILLNEVAVAAEISTQLASFSSIEKMVLYKKDGLPIYQYNQQNQSFSVDPLDFDCLGSTEVIEGRLRLYIDADYLGNKLGYGRLDIKIKTLKEVLLESFIGLFSFYLFLVFISYLLALIYARRFTQPVLKLVSYLEKVELDETLQVPVKTEENNEFGKLYDEVNMMLERIENSLRDQRMAAVAFETPSGMMITDVDERILRVNSAFTEITGYSAEEAIGQTPTILNSGRQDNQFYIEMKDRLKEQHYWGGEIYNRHKDGTVYPEYLTIQDVRSNDNDEVLYYVASFLDISLQKETEAKLEYMTQFDTLTGLANREQLLREVGHKLLEMKKDSWGAMICIDIKDFKYINDAYGHQVGDQLLQSITHRLQENFGECDIIARIGADEFLLWFNDLATDKEGATLQSKMFAEYLIGVLSQPFTLSSQKIHTIISLGIALYDHVCTDAHLLLKQADGALHLAKRQEKSIAFFDADAETLALSHIDMYTQLLQAISQEQFSLYCQYQYDADQKIIGAEALIRWIHPTLDVVSPAEFIPIAEKTGLIVTIGTWVINQACEQLAGWKKDTHKDNWVLAINISAKQFAQEDFVEIVVGAVKRHGVAFKQIKLELTETILVQGMQSLTEKMRLLQTYGIQISLDDFGTGYSSLQYLKDLPLDQVKIDQYFIKNMLNSAQDVAIIKSILLIGEAHELDVIAEGVESEAQFDFLRELGCRYFQGYYFAYPQPM